MAEVAKGVWLPRLLISLNIPHQELVTIRCDNQGAIKHVRYPILHKQTNHVDIKVFVIRELSELQLVDFQYVRTTEQAGASCRYINQSIVTRYISQAQVHDRNGNFLQQMSWR